MSNHVIPWLGRKLVLLTLAVATLAVLSFITVRALSQTDGQTLEPSTADPTSKPDAPGTIDGAKNPELIPDEVAWRMLFLAVAEPENATEEQKQRARAKIIPAHLSDEDANAFVALLQGFHEEMTAVQESNAEIRARNPFVRPNSTDWDLAVQLRKRFEQNVTSTIAALPARVSPDGMSKLQVHLQLVKRGIKRIPLKNMELMPMEPMSND